MSQTYEVEPLPYATDALASKGMCKETVELHYGKHHKGYATRLTAIAKEKPDAFKGKSVIDVIRSFPVGSVPYNMAAQIWNHDFYWKSMSPNGGSAPQPNASALAKAIMNDFGSFEAFQNQFTTTAAGHFGSGWCWLAYDSTKKKLVVVGTHDAVCPLSQTGLVPLMVCDVWEHAYYVDYRNDRPAFLKNWWKLVNWHFAERNFASAAGGAASKL
jgi:Fe-Mn family superoxide dismutase